MAYQLITQFDSPNHYRMLMPLPIRKVVWHWWGKPSGQDPYGVINWLCRPGGTSSSNCVIWPGHVAVIVNWDTPAWASGNYQINTTSISIEADPNSIDATIRTGVELLADLIRQGILHPDFVLSGHRDHQSTECPGTYYPRLGEIRRRVRDQLAGKPAPQPSPATRRLIMPDQTIRDYQGKPVTVEQILARIDAHVRPINRGNRSSEIRQEIADTKTIATATQAQIAALTAAVGALSKDQGVDPALVERAIREAIAEALDGLELSGEIKIGGTE